MIFNSDFFFFPCAHIFKAEENGVLWIICFAHRQRAGMASIAFNCLFLAPRSQTVIGKLFSLKKKKSGFESSTFVCIWC